jgi:hypothetical protein
MRAVTSGPDGPRPGRASATSEVLPPARLTNSTPNGPFGKMGQERAQPYGAPESPAEPVVCLLDVSGPETLSIPADEATYARRPEDQCPYFHEDAGRRVHGRDRHRYGSGEPTTARIARRLTDRPAAPVPSLDSREERLWER